MVLDKNNVLWVLCNGGWMRENYAYLFAINTSSNTVINSYKFPSITDSPSNLACNGSRDSIFWLKGDVFAMNIESTSLPDEPLIHSDANYFYKLAVNPFKGEIIVTDAGDYSGNGKLHFYSRTGDFIKSVSAGIIPGNLYFRNNENIINNQD
jgi:hypothetical protein